MLSAVLACGHKRFGDEETRSWREQINALELRLYKAQRALRVAEERAERFENLVRIHELRKPLTYQVDNHGLVHLERVTT